MNVNEFLEYVDKRIKKIEDKDPDYIKNPKWIELRIKQDEAFKELAKINLVYFEFLANKYINDDKKYKIYKNEIRKCLKYLGVEVENEDTL